MSRASDPHQAFFAWLVDGAIDEPPRDAALHASVCSECTRQVAALDALTSIDPGRAALPPSRGGVPARRRDLARGRLVAVAGAGALAAVTLGATGSLLLAGRPSPSPTQAPPAEGVLAATGTPAPTSATPSATPAETASPRPTAKATKAPRATRPPTPRPATPRPRPTAAPPAPTPTPTASPAPTIPATVSPSPSPSPSPTPTPSDSQTPSPTPGTPASSSSPLAGV